MTDKLHSFDQSMALFQRAANVIPGAIPGHLSPALTVPGSFPYYAVRGEGCRYQDVDGNSFIDYMCAYGPIILGYNNARVDEAARKQRERGSVFNHPTELSIELAERLVSLVPIADWATFGRNGSDVCTYLVLVARQHTQRRKVIRAKGAYHGTHAWCIHGIAGLIPEDYEHVLQVTWNDSEGLRALVKQHTDDVAAIILTPYHHPAFGDSILPTSDFMSTVRELCDQHGIVFILDDVRAGFRLHMGGSGEYFGFKPDAIAYCKALANGHVISAAVGREELKRAASQVFFTGSYFGSAAEMAAALACMDELEKTQAIPHMLKMGKLLQTGLKELSEKHGLQVTLSGPPSLPNMTFTNENNFLRMQRFSAEAARRGVFFHPHHNWFICAAHQEKDIQESLDVADSCFAIVKKEFGG
ncbi:MAG: aminotransferase class III-fold pyridoxal phosphate-dependent enzyme [Deltaproteobacteria bacterium]|nr:aminotransferase class III-fold pyridoxal phosphate-dependent enzyme [Deltaproteobacteria bacterium]